MKPLKLFTLILPFCFLLPGCGSTPQDSARKLIGKTVKVQFRRDALGGAASIPISPFTDNMNGADTSALGKVEIVEGNWIVIQRSGKLTWIPREVILAIEEPDNRKQ